MPFADDDAMRSCWTLRAAVAALALSTVAFGAGLAGYIRISHARRASLRDWNAQRCSVYRSTFAGSEDPCAVISGERPTLISSLKAARSEITNARAAMAIGEEEEASRALARALDHANAVERRSSLFATAVAARATSEVLDVVDANPSLEKRRDLRAALARTKLSTAQKPLEADRLRTAHAALNDPSARTAFITWGATDARIAETVERNDAQMLAMQHAVRAGDQASCERAGAKATIGPWVCASLVRTNATAKRLSALKTRSTRE